MRSVMSASLVKEDAVRKAPPFRKLILSLVAGTVLAVAPLSIFKPWQSPSANAQQDNVQDDMAPPPDDQDPGVQDDPNAGVQDDSNAGAPPTDDAANQSPWDNPEVEPLAPGEAVVTRFSHTIEGADEQGNPINVIDTEGISASIIDIRNPGEPPVGQHWLTEPQRMFVTAGEVGQVFGVAIANNNSGAPDIFLSATAAYGLHRMNTGAKKSEWMPGQWGADAGPGTIYRISAASGYKPEKFADVVLEGRENTGAALGNIAYDKAHSRLFVSDLETGMIHSFDVASGKDMGQFDHGSTGRTDFVDARTGQQAALEPVAFDPTTEAKVDTCGTDFSATPACWNIADFRRRVWGLKVRTSENGEVRLYYSVWGSDAFGNGEWAQSGDDRRNALWSVAISDDGLFDTTTVRREFFMPAFWPSQPSLGVKAGNSNPVADITFPECSTQNVMLLAERGGMRNLGLNAVEPFARPYESRVLRYEIGADNIWRSKGRYDVGFHDRSIKDGDPLLFASAAGGVDFNYKIGDDGSLDMATPSQSVWMTGDGLCSPLGGCTDKTKGEGADMSEVHGLQGTPADALGAVEPEGKPSPDALLRSYMIDTDINVDENGKPVASELSRNDATKIGDVAIYQVCEAAPVLPPIEEPVEQETEIDDMPPVEPPEVLPVHTLNMSHAKWASSGHRVRQSWHWREGSWHQANRSWHWRKGSWHSANRSWHWREGSWHSAKRSWHRRDGSWHDRVRSWHRRDGSWHDRARSWHRRDGSWHSRSQSWHDRARSWHKKSLSWDGGHRVGRSFHNRARSWDGGHRVGRSFHNRARSWDGGHRVGRSFHNRARSWDGAHNKRKSAGTDGHLRARSRTDGVDRHSRRESLAVHDGNRHQKWRSRNRDNANQHTRRRSNAGNVNKHQRWQSRNRDDVKQHSRRRSNAGNVNQHQRWQSRGRDNVQQHSSRRSNAGNVNQHQRWQSRGRDNVQQHSSRRSNAGNVNQHKRWQSRGRDNVQQHNSRRSNAGNVNQHKRWQSRGANQNTPRHNRRQSRLQQG